MYGNGEGVLQDNVYAHMWLNIDSANGMILGSMVIVLFTARLSQPVFGQIAYFYYIYQYFMWCPGPDLNRHDLNGRGILSPLCLPISPPGRSADKGGREGYHARAQSQAPRDQTQLKVSDC